MSPSPIDSPAPWRAVLAKNLRHVRSRIETAARSVSRDPAEITLVAVTKHVLPPVARALWELGQLELGENRVTPLLAKVAALPDTSIRWHYLGHLQRNKVRRLLPLIGTLHSLDSARLVEVLADAGPPPGFEAYLQVKWTDEPGKTGLAAEEVPAILELAHRRDLRIAGLMSMGVHADPERTARIFGCTAELARELEGSFKSPPRLSMGMSGDLELAIRHGAHVVRVGSDLIAGMDLESSGTNA